MTKYKSILLVILFLVAPQSTSAIPVPALDLTKLVEAADLIVVGEINDVRDDGSTTITVGEQSLSARRMIAKLNVIRVLKGRSNKTGLTFTFDVSDLSIGYAPIFPNQLGMFFLRRTSAETLKVVNPYYPFIVAARDAPATTGPVLDQVLAELEHVVTSPQTALEDRVRGIAILDNIRTVAVTQALEQAAQGPYGSAVFYAAAALLRRNNLLTLELAEKTLAGPTQNDQLQVRQMLAYAIRDGVSDPSALPVMARLMQVDDVDIRRCAVTALRHIASESAIDPLSKALSDNDREVRYQAVLGLATITGQVDWGPSIDLFIREESRYVTYWKDWLRVR